MKMMLKRTAKALLRVFGFLGALPWIIYVLAGRWFSTSELPFQHAAQAMALVPGFPGNAMRAAFFHQVLESCPLDVDIHFGSLFTHPETIVGSRVWIGLYCVIGTSELGDDVMIASRVSILSGKEQHGTSDPDVPFKDQAGDFRRITIGSGAWLGEGALVMGNIGKQSIVGTGSVVTRDMEDRVIVVGNPAKPIRKVFS